jgi:hypothetical protein
MGVACALLVQLDYLTNRSSKKPWWRKEKPLVQEAIAFPGSGLDDWFFFWISCT